MEYETSISAESKQKTTESDTEEANPGTHMPKHNACSTTTVVSHSWVCTM